MYYNRRRQLERRPWYASAAFFVLASITMVIASGCDDNPPPTPTPVPCSSQFLNYSSLNLGLSNKLLTSSQTNAFSSFTINATRYLCSVKLQLGTCDGFGNLTVAVLNSSLATVEQKTILAPNLFPNGIIPISFSGTTTLQGSQTYYVSVSVSTGTCYWQYGATFGDQRGYESAAPLTELECGTPSSPLPGEYGFEVYGNF
jgi:hypothetical protein